jgi:hypothetical protein
MTDGGHTMTEAWNLQLQGQVRDLKADLAMAEKHLETLAGFYMENADWRTAAEAAVVFLQNLATKRANAADQAKEIDRLVAEVPAAFLKYPASEQK